MKIEDIGTVYRLTKLGFMPDEIRDLARISATLRHLSVRACNGEGWGPMEQSPHNGQWFPQWTEADADRATKRIDSLMTKAQAIANTASGRADVEVGRLDAYHQGDPRGCALYIVPRDVLRGRPIGSCYTDGVAV